VPLQNLALAGVDPHDAGVASAFANASMHVGGSIAVAVFTAFYASSLEDALAEGVGQMPALASAYGDVFVVAGWVMVLGAVTSFLLIRVPRAAAQPPAGADAEADVVVAH